MKKEEINNRYFKPIVLITIVFLLLIFFFSINFFDRLFIVLTKTTGKVVYSSDLAAYYNLDDNILDQTGNKNHIKSGTDSSRWAVLTDGISGKGYRFDGLNDCAYIPRANNLRYLTKSSFSFSVWAKPEGLSTDPSVYWKTIFTTTYSGYPNRPYSTGIHLDSDGRPLATLVTSDGKTLMINSSQSISLDRWHNFVLNVDDSLKKVYLYVDGNLVGEGSYAGKILGDYMATPTPGYYYVGCYDFFNRKYDKANFKGVIDEIKIYNRALTSVEIVQENERIGSRESQNPPAQQIPGCVPNCSNKQCGDNGCGGSCGSCPGGEVCSNGVCITSNIPTLPNIQVSGNCNGIKDGIGIYDLSNGIFYLKDLSSNYNINFKFGDKFGNPKDRSYDLPGNTPSSYLKAGPLIPVSGDWDGDGKDSIGVYDQDRATFYLKNQNSEGNSDIIISFNEAEIQRDKNGVNGVRVVYPLVGDWDGDGKDGVALYDSNNGKLYLKNSLTSPNAEKIINIQLLARAPFGKNYKVQMKFIPISGDWDGDGKDEIGFYMGEERIITDPPFGEAVFALYSGTPLINKDSVSANEFYESRIKIPSNFRRFKDLFLEYYFLIDFIYPVVGDWNNDGKDEIGIYDSLTSTFYLKLIGGDITIIYGQGIGKDLETWSSGSKVVLRNSYKYPISGNWNNVCNRKCTYFSNTLIVNGTVYKRCGDDGCGNNIKCRRGEVCYKNLCVSPNIIRCSSDIDCGFPVCTESIDRSKCRGIYVGGNLLDYDCSMVNPSYTMNTPKCENNQCVIRTSECPGVCKPNPTGNGDICIQQRSCSLRTTTQNCPPLYSYDNFCGDYGHVYRFKIIPYCNLKSSKCDWYSNLKYIGVEKVRDCNLGCRNGECFECILDSDCSSGKKCFNNKCI